MLTVSSCSFPYLNLHLSHTHAHTVDVKTGCNKPRVNRYYMDAHCWTYFTSYFARGSGGKVLWWARLCVSCLSVHEHISGTTRTIFTNFSVWPWLGPPPAGWRNPKEKGQFWGLSRPFKSIGNLRCSRHCCVRCKRDHSIVNNITHQKGSFMLNAWLHVRVINFRSIIIIQYIRQVQTGIRKILSAAGDVAYWPGRGWGVHSTCKVISMTALFFALSVSCSTIATGLTGMLMILHYIQAVHQINKIAYSKRTQQYDSLS